MEGGSCWYLNKAELMPDYGVKTRSISVGEYLKRWLLVDLCLGTIKSTKRLLLWRLLSTKMVGYVYSSSYSPPPTSIPDPGLSLGGPGTRRRREEGKGGRRLAWGGGIKILQRVFICSQHLLSDQYF